MIGPLDTNLQKREITWISEANIIFVDNPVGTGYSYVTDSSKYTRNVDEIAKDLVTLMKDFLRKHPIFENLPFYVFSESYGGKMAAAFGKALYFANRTGEINCHLAGVALGDSWNHPMKSVHSWAPYLFSVAQVDENGYKKIQDMADKTQEACDKGQWDYATTLWAMTENVVSSVSAGCDFYNILTPRRARILNESSSLLEIYEDRKNFRILGGLDDLPNLMNGPIKQKLGIPSHVRWGGQSNAVFDYQRGDFMKPNVDTVVELLDLGVQVIVYTGNLDLICSSFGTLDWMREMKWKDTQNWLNANRKVLSADGTVQGFTKHYKNLKFYQFLTAGHMVPADQPAAAILMLKEVIKNN